MRGLLGLAALLAVAWVISEDRARIAWRTVAGGCEQTCKQLRSG